ncbi:hypothetical protein H5410_060870 [Solanum commersonii]|uniref:Uncharacterized protein n=1 Tax=Solanum commersonii TaxID=4109 RepID=A0A9J5W7E1_SOLCO|nr:hypothetical protein H5410_060870 [Solanum commersonii]
MSKESHTQYIWNSLNQGMHRLWGMEQKISLCGLELFEEVVRLFYTNLRVSSDNGELETFAMGNHIIVNEWLFKDIFGTKFFGVIPYMNGTWPNDFEVSMEGICLYSTTCLRNIEVTALFGLRITCGKVLRNLIPLPVYHHGLLISRFSMERLVDLSMFKPIEISATYDSRTFSSMGYMEVGNRWVRKDSVQEKTNTVRSTKISTESATLLLQDSDELKTRILVVECGSKTLHDVVEKVFRLQKYTITDVGKIRITMTGIKKEGITTFNKLIRQVDSLKS